MNLDGEQNHIEKKLGNLIKKIRVSKNMTEEYLGKECGLTKSQVWDIENGKVDVDYLVLFQIAAVLETPLSKLFEAI